MARFGICLGLGLALGACGTVAPLAPPEGANLPPAPFGATEKPATDELLELDALAAPERSVELRRRSEERGDDPFDLPPE
ncbi:hypothetical protein [Erythrobacter crassostreae]|uniref:Uncharacterized protein n=1 Tax=Erythrobacter crassostreae TaxID=2828328 RepID=A0A9X1JPG0_9SPHN|nr:hypothetical protein [Erythrobacter crassostrea]MBV7259387.1 hypothetical protein [Erythrobacter crassostrea]